MIKAIELKNFQAHENTRIEFCEGINMLTGHSRAGKTAVYRALKKIQTNKPSGTSMVSSWAKGSTKKGKDTMLSPFGIKVELDDGIIEYYKDNKLTKYSVDGVEYKAVATGVPDEVTNLLNMNEVNFAGQHDQPFLIRPAGLGGAEASRFLNSLINFSDADTALGVADRQSKSVNTNISAVEKNIADTTKKLTKYDNLKLLEGLISEYNKTEAQLKTDSKKLEVLESIVPIHNQNTLVLKNLTNTDVLEAVVDSINKVSKSLTKDESTLEKLTELTEVCNINEAKLTKLNDTDKLEATVDAINKKKFILDSLSSKVTSCTRAIESIKSSEEALEANFDTSKLQKAIDAVMNKRIERDDIIEAKEELEKLLSRLHRHETKVETAKKDLVEAQKTLDSMGTVCPTCKGKGVVYD